MYIQIYISFKNNALYEAIELQIFLLLKQKIEIENI